MQIKDLSPSQEAHILSIKPTYDVKRRCSILMEFLIIEGACEGEYFFTSDLTLRVNIIERINLGLLNLMNCRESMSNALQKYIGVRVKLVPSDGRVQVHFL